MLKFIIIAILGIAINFISKFANRKSRIKDFSFTYWIKDNWPELSIGLFVTIALLMMLLDSNTVFDNDIVYQKLSSWAPWLEGIYIEIRLILSFLIGLFSNHIVYWIMKKKQKSTQL